jgi:hypothetical protein
MAQQNIHIININIKEKKKGIYKLNNLEYHYL